MLFNPVEVKQKFFYSFFISLNFFILSVSHSKKHFSKLSSIFFYFFKVSLFLFLPFLYLSFSPSIFLSHFLWQILLLAAFFVVTWRANCYNLKEHFFTKLAASGYVFFCILVGPVLVEKKTERLIINRHEERVRARVIRVKRGWAKGS